MLFVRRMDERSTQQNGKGLPRLSVYGGLVTERLREPFGVGRLDHPTAVGEAGAMACRGLTRVELQVQEGIIEDARFQAYGCPATIACASEAVRLAKGSTLLEAASVGVDRIASALDLAAAKRSSAELAVEALQAALTDAISRVEILSPEHAGDDRGVLVGMSGGVDSAVAALLLKRQGFRVAGATLRLWIDPACDTVASCCSPESVRRARRVAHSLGIPHVTIDAVDAFRDEVVEYFLAEYSAGRTPNPCSKCNSRLRFPLLADVSRRLGLRYVATGHYARLSGEPPGLSRGVDRTKDQSYVLAEVPLELLQQCLFPLGEMCKPEVRALAAHEGIEGSEQPESQDICFVPDDDYRRFLRSHLGERPGDIVDSTGKRLGRHKGTYNFTIGQRKGLGIAAAEPLFVTGLDTERSEVSWDRRPVWASAKSWSVVSPGIVAQVPSDGVVQLRSSGCMVPGRLAESSDDPACAFNCDDGVTPSAPELVSIVLKESVLGVAPGQTAVFYHEDRVACAGTVVATESQSRALEALPDEKAAQGAMV